MRDLSTMDVDTIEEAEEVLHEANRRLIEFSLMLKMYHGEDEE